MPQQNLYEILTRYSDVGWVKKVDHPTIPDLSLFCYTSLTEVRKYWDPYTLRARGLVVHRDGTPVNNPFDKFFNLHEYGDDHPVGLFQTFAKLDGTMVCLSWYQDQPIWNTKGSFIAIQSEAARAWLEETFDYGWMEPGHTYTFEWIAPENRNVVDYQEQRGLVLLSDRDLAGKEYDIDHSPWPGDVAAHFEDLDCQDVDVLKRSILADEEGYVLLYGTGARVKVKGEDYLRLHRLRWGLSEKQVWELLACFPEKYDDYRAALDEECLAWFDAVATRLRGEFARLLEQSEECVSDLSPLACNRKELLAQVERRATPEMPAATLLAVVDEKWQRVHTYLWRQLKPVHKPFVPMRRVSEAV